MEEPKVYKHTDLFSLENGEVIEGLEIAYHTFGSLNDDCSNVIWICHALTANSNPFEWWPGLVGEGCLINPEKHFIICANVIGSCYGTTGPFSDKGGSDMPYGLSFPNFTVRDVASAHLLLLDHLKLSRIKLLIGGSFGGFQALEMAIIANNIIENLLLLATSAKETAWGIAIHEAQRMAIESDPTWKENYDGAGANGLKAARGVGLLTYRTYRSYIDRQTDSDGRLDDFSAASYIKYQGEKLEKRFNAQSYWYLTKCLDSHDVGRARNGLKSALTLIKADTIVIGINSDLLVPTDQQSIIVEGIPGARYYEIQSDFGHDGFLIEVKKIGQILLKEFRWLID